MDPLDGIFQDKPKDAALFFTNGKIVGAGIDPAAYARQTVQRGHRDFAMSQGELMVFASNPARWLAGYREEIDEQCIAWGSLIDCLVLTPERFESAFAVAPETYPAEGRKKGDPTEEKPWNWNAGYCKDWRVAQGDKTVLKSDQHKRATDAAASLFANDDVKEFIGCSARQVMVVGEYRDRATGIIVPVKSLIDLLPDSAHPLYGDSLADLKTARNASPSAWRREVNARDYNVQGAFYTDLLAAAGDRRDEFRHIVQESFAPWAVGRRILSYEYVELGRERYRDALALYARCLRDGEWPGYDDGWTTTEPEIWMVQ